MTRSDEPTWERKVEGWDAARATADGRVIAATAKTEWHEP